MQNIKSDIQLMGTIAFAEYEGSKGEIYETKYDYSEDKGVCTCIAFYFKKRCKHIEDLKSRVKEDENMVVSLDTLMGARIEGYSSSLQALNDLYDGDVFYTKNSVLSLFAKPDTGKTLVFQQDAVFLSDKAKILYVDTETGITDRFISWLPKFVDRFPKANLKNIKIEQVVTLDDFMWFMGIKDIDDRIGKRRVNELEKSDTEPLEKIMSKYKPDLVFIDSLSMPFKDWEHAKSRYPEKASIEGQIMSRIFKMSVKFGAGFAVLNHGTFNPIDPRDNDIKLSGGSNIQFAIKRKILMEKRGRAGLEDFRTFTKVRGEDKDMGNVFGFMQIKNKGCYDITDISYEEACSLLLTPKQTKALVAMGRLDEKYLNDKSNKTESEEDSE